MSKTESVTIHMKIGDHYILRGLDIRTIDRETLLFSYQCVSRHNANTVSISSDHDLSNAYVMCNGLTLMQNRDYKIENNKIIIYSLRDGDNIAIISSKYNIVKIVGTSNTDIIFESNPTSQVNRMNKKEFSQTFKKVPRLKAELLL